MVTLEQKVADAHTAKSRAQHQTWRLQRRLKEEGVAAASTASTSANRAGFAARPIVQSLVAEHGLGSQGACFGPQAAGVESWSSPTASSSSPSPISSAAVVMPDVVSAKDEFFPVIEQSTASSWPRPIANGASEGIGREARSPVASIALKAVPLEEVPVQAKVLVPVAVPPEETVPFLGVGLKQPSTSSLTTASTAPSSATSQSAQRPRKAVAASHRPSSLKVRRQVKGGSGSCHRFAWPEDLELSPG